MAINCNGNLQYNSGIGSAVTAYGVRAWIHFDGAAGTIGSGDARGNVSSVTDYGTGNYVINFANNMPDANYVVFGTADWSSTWGAAVYLYRDVGNGWPSSSAFSIRVAGTTNYTSVDARNVMIGVVR